MFRQDESNHLVSCSERQSPIHLYAERTDASRMHLRRGFDSDSDCLLTSRCLRGRSPVLVQSTLLFCASIYKYDFFVSFLFEVLLLGLGRPSFSGPRPFLAPQLKCPFLASNQLWPADRVLEY